MVVWILFIFGIQKFIHHRSVLSESEHSSFKNRVLEIGSKTQNGDFLKNSNDFDYISVMYGDLNPK
jgi:hypothetical protein